MPKPEAAPSNLAIVGRYVLPGRIFDLLESTTAGAGGEIQLTDAIEALLAEQPVLAYRFEGDKFCKAARFEAFENALGDRFIGRVLPDDAANPDSPMKNPHSVVTIHLIDEAGQPTVQARDEILDFFRMRLSG